VKLKIKPPKKDGAFLTALPAMLIAAVITCVVFAVKHIFPFGSGAVAYMDMWQMNVPLYYHVYDFLHGDKSVFYDLYTGLGMNMSESVAICSLLSPFNLFFYFVPRDRIIDFMSLYTLLKIEFAVFFMSTFLRYRFKKVHNFWRTIASFAYGFCGLNMMFYTNSQWLDIAALLPVLMLALDYSITNKKVIPYAFALALLFIVNPYISVMVLLFVFFAASAYIIFFAPKNEKAVRVLNLGIGTGCGVAMSAFIILPFMSQMGKTARSPSNLIDTIKNVLLVKNDFTSGYALQKSFMLWGTALACAVIIYGIILNWKSVKRNIISLVCIAVAVLPIFFENINLFWHGGSYVLFPMRFGFISSFILWAVAISYINNIPNMNTFMPIKEIVAKSPLKAVLLAVWALICTAGVPFVAKFIAGTFRDTDSQGRFTFFFTLFGVLVGIYFVFVNKSINHFLRLVALALVSAEVGAGVYLFIGKPYIDPFFQNTPDMKFAEEIIDTRNSFEMSDSLTSRVKNADGEFTANYPFVMHKSALANWTHSVDAKLQTAYKGIGYSIVYTRLLDTGGTVFMDAVMNVEDVITKQDLPEKSYTLVETADRRNHYKTNYNLGFGITMSSMASDIPSYVDAFTAQEYLYEYMSGDVGLFNVIQSGTQINSNVITQKFQADDTVTYEMDIAGCQNLYLTGYATIKIQVNGEDIEIPDAGIQNYYYPSAYNNGIIDLGVFENEHVTVSLKYPNGIDDSFLYMALMDYSKLDSFVQNAAAEGISAEVTKENGSGFELKAVGSLDNDLLLIPISYDEGLTCKVNGESVEVEPVLGCFSGVRIDAGENVISIKFVPDGMKKGMLIAIAGLAVLLAYHFIFIKKYSIKFGKAVESVAVWEFGKLWIIALIALYLIPILYQFFHKV